MTALSNDLRLAARRRARTPGFTAGAAALLAVGIGANTAVFTVVDALLFRPPAWERPEEVVHVYQDSDDGEPSSSSFPAYRDMAASEVFSAVAATSPTSAAWDGPDGPVDVAIEYTTASYLDVLGLSPSRGRWFEPGHDGVGNRPVAVVSEPAWRARFGGDPGVVGRTVRLNGQPVTVVGVGPEGLSGTLAPLVTDFWLSISATVVGGDVRVQNLDRRQDHWYDVRARLAPGVSVERAREAMDALAARLAEEYPALNRGRDITVFPSKDVRFHPGGDGDLRRAGALLSAVSLTVLLLACANLANLLLVRGLGRSGEVAVRRALGAGRGRVARLFLLEALLLTGAGGLLGLALARWALVALPALPIDLPGGGVLGVGMDLRVVAFAAALVVVTGGLFGLAPAVRSARTDVVGTLRDDRRTASVGHGTARLRNALVAVQVGASLVLVLGAGLLARSLAALQGADTGVDADRVAWVRMDLSRAGLDAEEGRVLLRELLGRLEALPAVSRAAATSRLPAQRSGTTTTEVEGYTPPAGTSAVELDWAVVTDGYFETMGIPLLEGRVFGPDDAAGGGASVLAPGEAAVLVNETAARRFWGSSDVVGRRMRAQGSERWSRVVVGVVGDAPVAALREPVRPMFYYTARQASFTPSYLVVRAGGDPASLLPALRREVPAARATLAVSRQGTLVSHFGEGLAGPRTAARMLGVFSLLAVVLAGLGVYAVVSFSVERRSGEMGIRMALGAARGRVVRAVVGEVVASVVVGVLGGLGVAGLVAPRLDGVLYGVRGLDPVTFAGSALFLLAVAGAAAYLPARRAAGADPVEALRAS